MHGVGILEKWLRDNSYVNSSEYRGQLNAFEFANKELIRHSTNRDIEGSLNAYLKLSESCVMCHQHIRDADSGGSSAAAASLRVPQTEAPAPKRDGESPEALEGARRNPANPAGTTRTVNAPEPREPRGATPGEKSAPILRKFMRRKLGSSTRILEGLVTEDAGKISRGATELLTMSEEEKWRASNDMMYLQHSREFRDTVRKLHVKAKSGSLDGAALAWIDVTMSCISCHDWVRDVLVVGTELREPPDESQRLLSAIRRKAPASKEGAVNQ